MDSILLATDGSEYARRAAVEAIAIAAEEDATLHVICVVDRERFDEPALSAGELATIYAEEHADLSVKDVERMAESEGVTVTGETRHGVPHELVVEYAEDVDADVIVVGEHGDHDDHFANVGEKVTELTEREVRVVEADHEE